MHLYQCFGSYWNNLADQADGWSTHLQVSCEEERTVAVEEITVAKMKTVQPLTFRLLATTKMK